MYRVAIARSMTRRITCYLVQSHVASVGRVRVRWHLVQNINGEFASVASGATQARHRSGRIWEKPAFLSTRGSSSLHDEPRHSRSSNYVIFSTRSTAPTQKRTKNAGNLSQAHLSKSGVATNLHKQTPAAYIAAGLDVQYHHLNMPHSRKLRKNAIRAFRISPESHTIRQDDWASGEPHAFWYGMPTEVECIHPEGGTYKRCQVEAFNQAGQAVGYLPLPRRYSQAWIQLCYAIVYWLSTWKAWLDELGRPPRVRQQPGDLVQLCIDNTGTRLIKYLHIRRLIVDELLHHRMSQNESDDELDIFDEYLIRDRYDWLWQDFGDIPEKMLYVLNLDPVHPSNEGIFSESLRSPLISNGIDRRVPFSLEKSQPYHPPANDRAQSLAGANLDMGKDQPL